jgi:hypothetical protein
MLTAAATVSPLMALWLKIPALLSPLLGPTVGKILTLALAAGLIAGAGALARPLFTPPPTPTEIVAPSTSTALPAGTETPTATGTPTAEPSPTRTPTGTATPTATATASLTPTPTYAVLTGEMVNRAACFHGPGNIYLYRFGLIPGNRMEVRGRAEVWNGRQLQTWVWGLPEFFAGECWVDARNVKLDGDLASLEPVYPEKVELPFLRDPRWPLPQNLEVERLGDRVTIAWDLFDVPLGERESPNSPRYILEAWLCRDGQVLFTPIPVYEFTQVEVIDQAGCAEPSHGRVILAEKHGYAGPVEIRWPPYPQTTPTP